MDSQIIMLGDIHGDYHQIQKFFNRLQLTNVSLFQVGDFGVGFTYNEREVRKELKTLQLLSDFLVKRESHLYVIRGNHDDPSFFDGEHNFDGITFLQDYDVVEVNGLKILGIGGATSVDKVDRKEGKDWWAGEKPVFDESKLDLTGIDVVITHTAPNFTQPFGGNAFISNYISRTMGLAEELLEERNILAKISDKILENNTPRFWFYGHFHQSYMTEVGDVMMIGLDINEFYELLWREEQI